MITPIVKEGKPYLLDILEEIIYQHSYTAAYMKKLRVPNVFLKCEYFKRGAKQSVIFRMNDLEEKGHKCLFLSNMPCHRLQIQRICCKFKTLIQFCGVITHRKSSLYLNGKWSTKVLWHNPHKDRVLLSTILCYDVKRRLTWNSPRGPCGPAKLD